MLFRAFLCNTFVTLFLIEYEIGELLIYGGDFVTVICVDNTPIMLQSLKENAKEVYPQANTQTFLAENEAFDYAKKAGCDVLLCEINPPRLEGLFLAEKIQKINPKVNIIFVTVCSENEHAKAVMKLKPSCYLTKEATNTQILDELKNLRYPVQ